MMKCRREMTAEQHLMMLVDKGEIKVKDHTIIVYTDDDGETSQVVADYMVHFSRKGYAIIYK